MTSHLILFLVGTFSVLLKETSGLGDSNGTTVCTLPSGTCYLGSQLSSDAGSGYYSFQGIRYAMSPTGDLRFKEPVPWEAGETVVDVSGESRVTCAQWNSDYTALAGQEDCLLLNVYVPGRF